MEAMFLAMKDKSFWITLINKLYIMKWQAFKEVTDFDNPFQFALYPILSIKNAWLSGLMLIISFEAIKVFFEQNIYPSFIGVLMLVFLYIVNFVLSAYHNIKILKVDKGLSAQKAGKGIAKLFIQITFVVISRYIILEYSTVFAISKIFYLPLSEFLLLSFTINRFLNCWEVARKMDFVEERLFSLVKNVLSLDVIFNKFTPKTEKENGN